MSPERPEQDDFLEDEEQEEYEGQRSIFATGWFRAVLVLLVLAVIAVIAVPLIGGWFEPTPPPRVTTTAPPAPSTPVPAPPPAPTPSTPAPPATPPSVGTPPSTTAPSTATPSTPSTPSPAAPTPAPPVTAAPTPAPAKPEMPATSTPKAPEKARAPERTATAKSSVKAPATGSGGYWVQVGAFKESRNAEGLAKALRSEGFAVQITRVTRDEPLHVVRVGGYPDRSRATAAREELQGKGHAGFVTSGPAK